MSYEAQHYGQPVRYRHAAWIQRHMPLSVSPEPVRRLPRVAATSINIDFSLVSTSLNQSDGMASSMVRASIG